MPLAMGRKKRFRRKPSRIWRSHIDVIGHVGRLAGSRRRRSFPTTGLNCGGGWRQLRPGHSPWGLKVRFVGLRGPGPFGDLLLDNTKKNGR